MGDLSTNTHHIIKIQFGKVVFAQLHMDRAALISGRCKVRFQLQHLGEVVQGEFRFAQSKVNCTTFEVRQIIIRIPL